MMTPRSIPCPNVTCRAEIGQHCQDKNGKVQSKFHIRRVNKFESEVIAAYHRLRGDHEHN